MPYTRKQVRYLLSKVTPLSTEQQQRLKEELRANPRLGHARKGSKELKRS